MTNEISQELSVEEQRERLMILCKEMLDIEPRHEQAVDSLVWCYEELGQFDLVIDLYNQCLSLDSDKNNLHFLRGLARFAHKHDLLDLAAESYQRILNSGLDEGEIGDEYVQLGIIYRKQGEYDLAIECFQRVLFSEWGQYANAAFELGITYSEQGDFDLAIEYFQQVLKEKPDDLYTLYNLGFAYHGQGRLDLAIECFENLLHQDSDNFEMKYSIWFQLGVIYREANQLDMAIERFQSLITGHPEDYANIWHELGITYEMLNREKTAELIRVGTLLSASTLTTGLAHEIKNPLAGIQLTVSNLLSDLEDGSLDVNTLRADLLKIQSNATRINDRISQARRLADDTLDPTKPPSTDMVELKQLFQHTLEGFQQQLSIENITVELEVAENLPFIEANAISLEQVLANLISNAIDALRSQEERIIRLTAEFIDPHMVITCHDNGMGIDPDTQRRIFEPLFTTKSRGQGTGIGLWLCKTIIEHWHGTIRFVSAPGQGTTFTITLPLKQEEA